MLNAERKLEGDVPRSGFWQVLSLFPWVITLGIWYTAGSQLEKWVLHGALWLILISLGAGVLGLFQLRHVKVSPAFAIFSAVANLLWIVFMLCGYLFEVGMAAR
ncbi:hypothetical protein BH09VER1_BH09VER1_48930 [soil metagenome]